MSKPCTVKTSQKETFHKTKPLKHDQQSSQAKK